LRRVERIMQTGRKSYPSTSQSKNATRSSSYRGF